MQLDRFINRPVLSTVISIVIVILGVLGLVSLPITQYPDIAPPTVEVSTTYTGANAQTVLNSVIAPLEEQINGVENMDYMSSTATNTGSASIDITFKQGTDPNMAAVNVQNRVAKAQGLLPSEVTQIGVITQKRQTSMLVIFSIVVNRNFPTYQSTFATVLTITHTFVAMNLTVLQIPSLIPPNRLDNLSPKNFQTRKNNPPIINAIVNGCLRIFWNMLLVAFSTRFVACLMAERQLRILSNTAGINHFMKFTGDFTTAMVKPNTVVNIEARGFIRNLYVLSIIQPPIFMM